VISVVIPTYQRRAAVERALTSLGAQTMPATAYEVIVAIDGSDDGTREMVAAFSAPYRLQALWQPNRGRAAACNAGIRAAGGDLVVLLDDDMEAAPELLAAHERAHGGAPARAVIGAAPVLPDDPTQPLAEFIRAGFARRLARLSRPDCTIRFNDVYTGNFSIRRATLLDVGAFDEDFRDYGHEDYELAVRLLDAGVELRYSADAVAYHHYDKTLAAVARDSIGRGRNDVLFGGKHPEVRPHLRLGGGRGSRRRRLTRGALLLLSHAFPGISHSMLAFVQSLERRRTEGLDGYYDFVLDYFYWLGATAALRERRKPALGAAAQRE
jgi:glycosyltransferase involved in cell wall biosynthesis